MTQISGFDWIVVICYGILLLPLIPGLGFVAGLWGFHSYIIITNQSTNEYLKSQWKTYGMNPFRRYIIINSKKSMAQLLAGTFLPSKEEFSFNASS